MIGEKPNHGANLTSKLAPNVVNSEMFVGLARSLPSLLANPNPHQTLAVQFLICLFLIYFFQLLNALQMFGSSLDDYLHLLVPPVVKLFDSSDIPLTVRRLVNLTK